MHASASGPLPGDEERAARVGGAAERLGDVRNLGPEDFAKFSYDERLAVYAADRHVYAALAAGRNADGTWHEGAR